MIFLGGTKIIFSWSHYCFTAKRKKSFSGKVLRSLKKLLLCCFITDKNKNSCQLMFSCKKREKNVS